MNNIDSNLNDFEGIEFKPIPGYEGTYSISAMGYVRNDKYNRLLHSTVTKKGQEVITLYKNTLPKMHTVKSLISITWWGKQLSKGKPSGCRKKIKCENTDQVFDSYKECCNTLNLDYRGFLVALKKSNEYKGYKFKKIN